MARCGEVVRTSHSTCNGFPTSTDCGLGVIVGGHTIVSVQGGRLLLLNVAECLHDLVRVMKVLEIFDSEQEAVRSVSPETAA